ncbi:MAG: hypothetical protein M0R17_02940, partial [Candidatus Omnitrophica bacterium]|nr:hypothetical protein [Candidatus Omnitrophota bacterium]
WYEQHTKYWGLDQELLFKYRDLVIEHEIESNKIQEAQWKIEREWKTKNPEPKYAYSNGINSITKKKYTKKEIDTYDTWSKNKKQYLENHKEYKQLENKRKESFKYWDQQNILEKELGALDAKAFIKDNKKNFIYIVEYADDNHTGCTMEHGNVFKNIEHIRISNH